jgi:hypothetical protein
MNLNFKINNIFKAIPVQLTLSINETTLKFTFGEIDDDCDPLLTTMVALNSLGNCSHGPSCDHCVGKINKIREVETLNKLLIKMDVFFV